MTGLVAASHSRRSWRCSLISRPHRQGRVVHHWAFFTKSPVPRRDGGGVANAIVGTGSSSGGALIGLPIGIGAASSRRVWLGAWVPGALHRRRAERHAVDRDRIFAWTWMVKRRRFSALAGSAALAILMIPMIARTTEEMVRLVPTRCVRRRWRSVPTWRTSLRVVARTALGGIVTGLPRGDRPRRRRDGACCSRAGNLKLLDRRSAPHANPVAPDLRVRDGAVRECTAWPGPRPWC